MTTIYSPLKNITRIQPKYQKALKKLGLVTVADFLFYFPTRYDDFSKIVSLSSDYLNQNITIEGKIIKTTNRRIFKKRLTLTEIRLVDENDTPLKAVWFNQPFILESFKVNTAIRLSGKLDLDGKIFTMANPSFEKVTREKTNTGCLVPIYRETTGITSKWIRWQIKLLLPYVEQLIDPLPKKLLKKYKLYHLKRAILQIHFPSSEEKLKIAQKRLAFEEMLLVQLRALQIKKEWKNQKSFPLKTPLDLINTFIKDLPFTLTAAQKKANIEILKDLEKTQPMNRLLNGDVGAGKTVLAIIASLQIISAGYQVAIMAPTEILAYQHFENFCQSFKNYNFKIALLTGSNKILNSQKTIQKRDDLLKKIGLGKIDLIVGTHALIQKDVQFKNLAFVVIDEQHRFGVAQRAELQEKTLQLKNKTPQTIPHLLTMTATPIPRTLTIALFGSLNLSVLDELPKNRKPVKTKIVSPNKRLAVYNFIRQEINLGHQAFIILPLVKESQSLTNVKAVIEEHQRLATEVFPEFTLGLLHGKLKPKEKEKIMQNFKNNQLQILVSTSVIEVGIDIPNATVMIIENAERFGLAQLHQFRGRVGRGICQSYCFLFSKINSLRLKALEKTNDGFKIAEQDLKLRGPGQFFGTIQSGIPDITMENLTNIKLIKFAQLEATAILKHDPFLKKHLALKDSLQKFSENIHLE